MRTVGLKVLKNKLSEYVRIAAAGETVVVTDRNRVVAELVPPHPKRPLSDDAFVAQGVREGWLTPAKAPHGPLPPRRAPLVKFEDLMREIEEDREDR
ncbi:MAG TPA: type II toxin-antitoxin system prevent-host-death family antitoxin [Stellaceae bacterium]|jgi:prevent-host-death family protein|nr:type II toxin-antitoxin system prevent-host-death family antitoxin [Stellaceae bacterium]